MNKFRQRHPDHATKAAAKPAKSTFGLTDDAEDSTAAKGVYAVAESHRAGVIAKDKAAKARRKSGRRG